MCSSAISKYQVSLSVKEKRQKHLSVWSRTIKGEIHIAFPIDICHKKGMQLFTGHDIITSCSIRGAQKNETLGSRASFNKWKKKIACGAPQNLTALNIALPLCELRDKEFLQAGLLSVQGGRYLFSTIFIIYPSNWYNIYRRIDLCWT